MAEEAEQVTEEVEAEVVSEPVDPLEEMQAMLDGADEAPAEAEAETEQESAVEDSGGVDAGEEEAEEAADAEGPSYLMKEAAVRAGVDPDFIAVAESDEQLERLIETKLAKSREPAAESVVISDEPLTVELPEDEFPADDPMRKALQSMVDKLNAERAMNRKVLAQLSQFAVERIDREEAEQARAMQQVHDKLYKPFDEALDSFDSPVLGKSGKLTKAQHAQRAALAVHYTGLGATADRSPDENVRLAELVVQAHRKDLVEQRNQKQQATTRQAKQVLGGGTGGKRPVGPAPTEADVFKEWNDALTGKKPLVLQ